MKKKKPRKTFTKPFREVGTMKKGDYMIHVILPFKIFQVFVELVKQIKVPDGNTVDPVIEVNIMKESKFTSSKDNVTGTGVITWNEHLFFEPKSVVSSSTLKPLVSGRHRGS